MDNTISERSFEDALSSIDKVMAPYSSHYTPSRKGREKVVHFFTYDGLVNDKPSDVRARVRQHLKGLKFPTFYVECTRKGKIGRFGLVVGHTMEIKVSLVVPRSSEDLFATLTTRALRGSLDD